MTGAEAGQQMVLSSAEGEGHATAVPPGVRRRAPLSVRMDDALADDLAVMARAGLNASDAVRVAVGIVSGTYENAWSAGVLPEGVQPVITECVIRPYDGPPAA